MAVATSDTSARVGTGDSIIDSSICVATITGLAAARAPRIRRFWIGGTEVDRQFDAKVAARHHDAVRDLQNGVIGLHGGGLFDLGQDRGAATWPRARASITSSGRCTKDSASQSTPSLAGEFQVAPVFFRQGGHGQHHVGHVHALAVGNRAPHGDGAIRRNPLPQSSTFRRILPSLTSSEAPGSRAAKISGWGRLHAVRVTGGGGQVHAELGALDQLFPSWACEHAHAQFRALKVGQNADRAAGILLDLGG